MLPPSFTYMCTVVTSCTNPLSPFLLLHLQYLKTVFFLQQKLKNIACFWERQPSGCVRINCAFHHSKPRHINGLFLPPTNNAPLPQGDQEGILPPAQCQSSFTGPENIVLPIHPPLIINLNNEADDEEDDEEENEEKCKQVFSILYKQLEWVLSNITMYLSVHQLIP
ncbi:uncharacterized protein C12orf50 homolog [Ara ararauna]